MIKVASAPIDSDLLLFSRWLSVQGYVHVITEEQGEQVILMADDRVKDQLESALRRYLGDPTFRRQLDRHAAQLEPMRNPPMIPYPRATPVQAPVIFGFILISIVIAWLTGFGQGGPVLRFLLIIDPMTLNLDLNSFQGRIQALFEMLARGQFWRFISPDFIHFNVMHITFNLLMLWILGGQLELKKGSVTFIGLALFVSVVSNIAQFLDTGYLFGGLSGVVYGLVGYCWLWQRQEPYVFFPNALMKFSLVWLVLGYTSITESLGLGRMANSAHLYGLLAGLMWGWVTLNHKTIKNPKNH